MQPEARRIAIEASLEAAAERLGDPAPLVYERLFRAHPTMEAYFWRDRDGAVRGEMLAQTFAVVLDLVGERRFGAQMIRNEVVTHEGYEIPRDVFSTFFAITAAALKDALGEHWTPQMTEAWAEVLTEIDGCVGQSPRYDQSNPYFEDLRRQFESAFVTAPR